MHTINFQYNLPEWGTLEIDLDPDLSHSEKEMIALREIEEAFPDVLDIEITKIED